MVESTRQSWKSQGGIPAFERFSASVMLPIVQQKKRLRGYALVPSDQGKICSGCDVPLRFHPGSHFISLECDWV